LPRRRVVALAIALPAAAVILVGLGRYELHHGARAENAEMSSVLAGVGSVATAPPSAYRVGPPDCLAYATPHRTFGLQLCFDRSGRLVETVDRRGSQPRYASLVYDEALATTRLPESEIARVFPGRRLP